MIHRLGEDHPYTISKSYPALKGTVSLPLKKGRASPKGKPCFPSMNFQGQARRLMERTVQDGPLPVMNRLNKFLLSRVFWSKWKPFIIVRPSIGAPKLQPPIYKVFWPQLPIYKAIYKGYLRRFLKKTWWGPSWKPTHAPHFGTLKACPKHGASFSPRGRLGALIWLEFVGTKQFFWHVRSCHREYEQVIYIQIG